MRFIWKVFGLILLIRGAMGVFAWFLVLLDGELDGFGLFQGFFSLVLIVGGVLLLRGRRHGKARGEV